MHFKSIDSSAVVELHKLTDYNSGHSKEMLKIPTSYYCKWLISDFRKSSATDKYFYI